MISDFIEAEVRIFLVIFPIRTTSVVYEELLPNNFTNDFWPITMSR